MLSKKIYLIAAMIIPFFASILYFYVFDGEKYAPVIYLGAKTFLVVYPLFFLKKIHSFKKAFKFDIEDFITGCLVGVTIFVVGMIVIKIPSISAALEISKPIIKSKLASFGVLNHYIIMAVIISFLHSMLEEYYWRYFVYGTSQANIVSAISFSLHHFVVLSFYFSLIFALFLTIIVALGGVLFNLLYARNNNIWGAWSAHVGADLFIFYIGGILIGL